RPIVLSLPTLADPAVAVAGSRAGVVGVLSLEHVREAERAEHAVVELVRHGGAECGVLLGDDPALAGRLLASLPARITWVVLGPGAPPEVREAAGSLRARGVRVVWQVCDVRAARRAVAAGV